MSFPIPRDCEPKMIAKLAAIGDARKAQEARKFDSVLNVPVGKAEKNGARSIFSMLKSALGFRK